MAPTKRGGEGGPADPKRRRKKWGGVLEDPDHTALKRALLITTLQRYYAGDRFHTHVLPWVAKTATGEAKGGSGGGRKLNKRGGGGKDSAWPPLRLLEHLVTTYARDTGPICWVLPDGTLFNLEDSYRVQLKAWGKECFDIFRRRERLSIQVAQVAGRDSPLLETTVAQLNFFRWAVENGVLEYARAHQAAITAHRLAHQAPLGPEGAAGVGGVQPPLRVLDDHGPVVSATKAGEAHRAGVGQPGEARGAEAKGDPLADQQVFHACVQAV